MEKEMTRELVLCSRDITEFQRRVYLALLEVPRGQTITYGELGRRVGCRCAQAIGQALRRNPFAPDVPCHRVVAADGSLCGFNGYREGAELERKRHLLEEEGAISTISGQKTCHIGQSASDIMEGKKIIGTLTQ